MNATLIALEETSATTQTCTRCGETRPVDHFYLESRTRKDGSRRRRLICIACWRIDSRYAGRKYRRTEKGRAYSRRKKQRDIARRTQRHAAERADTQRMVRSLIRKTLAGGITVSELARLSGLHPSTIRTWRDDKQKSKVFPHVIPSIIRGCQLAERKAEQQKVRAFVPEPPKPKAAPKPRRTNNANHPWRRDEEARYAAMKRRTSQ